MSTTRMMQKGVLKLSVLFFSFFIATTACKKPVQYKEVQVTDLFTLQIPGYLNGADENFPFHVAAQYSNDSAGIFLMVLDTNRAGMNENTLKMYYDSVVSQPFIDSAKITPAQFTKINADSAYVAEMTGKENGVKLFYELEAIATPTKYYMLLIWGKEADKADLKPDFLKVLGSFRDISHKKI